MKDHMSPHLNALANLITLLLLAPGVVLAAPEIPAEPPSAQALAQPTTEQANPQNSLGSSQEAATNQPADSQAQRDEEFKKLVTNVRLV